MPLSIRAGRWCTLVVLLSALIALVSARPYAGGYNDGSRLATVESLVDRRTFCIERSVYFRPVPADDPSLSKVWHPKHHGVLRFGTQDKLYINKRYYSDKPPLTAVFMAGQYQVLQWLTGLRAYRNPDRFAWWMSLLSSGLSYVVSCWALCRIAGALGLKPTDRALVVVSFSLATVAPAYSRNVNASILLMAIAFCLYAVLIEVDRARSGLGGRAPWGDFLLAGLLCGLGYTTDLGSGPLLLACTFLLVMSPGPWRRWAPLSGFLAGSLPLVIAHHVLNYWIGGTLRPLSSVKEFFDWPGSPWLKDNALTGTGFAHPNVVAMLVYELRLLFGRRNVGFLWHNLPLLLTIPGVVILARRRIPELPLVLHGVAWSVLTWQTYGALSNNYSGNTVSIRWLVPTLAPGFVILVLVLRECPGWRSELMLLTLQGSTISLYDWSVGTWDDTSAPYLLAVVASVPLALLALAIGRRRWRMASARSDRATSPGRP
jgi:hypothetical protein